MCRLDEWVGKRFSRRGYCKVVKCKLIVIHAGCAHKYVHKLYVGVDENTFQCVPLSMHSWITNTPLTSKASFSCVLNTCISHSPVGPHNDILSPQRPPLFHSLFPRPSDWLLCTATDIQLLAALQGSGEMRYKCHGICGITAQNQCCSPWQ